MSTLNVRLLKVVGGMYLTHSDHQQAKKAGKVFQVDRATLKTKWTWVDPGLGKLGADFALDYIDSAGRYQRIDTIDFNPFSGAVIEHDKDVTAAFSPANFGVNLLIVTNPTHGDFAWNTNKFKAEHTLSVFYRVGS